MAQGYEPFKTDIQARTKSLRKTTTDGMVALDALFDKSNDLSVLAVVQAIWKKEILNLFSG